MHLQIISRTKFNMGPGTIFYYLLWPVVIVALLFFWLFKYITLLIEIGVSIMKELHVEIKNF